ncbi:MAG: L,D-transpeptidase family protein [Gammaproteobacteria bacterium]|nr:L,D-transpeptidase family protein [Gammaproteobacteria bacterium]
MKYFSLFFFCLYGLFHFNTVSAENTGLLASLGNSPTYTSQNILALKDSLKNLDVRLADYPDDYEASLLKSLVYFRVGEFQQAITELDGLIARVPDFHLAHLIRGDILLARVKKLNGLGNNSILNSLSHKQSTLLKSLLQESQMRLGRIKQDDLTSHYPRQILNLGESVEHALIVEKSTHRLYAYKRQDNGQPPKLLRDFYVSTGKKEGNKQLKGDLRTPEGVYFVTSWIPEEKLPDKYGVGAFPVNYPNELDQRQGKTGYGIWLHGTPSKFYSRPPLDSEGCVVLTNEDFNTLKQEITPGVTPIVIVEKVDWLDRTNWIAERDLLLGKLEQWRMDWESLDTSRYLDHYAQNFWSKGHNYKSWSKRKKRLASNKSYQKIQLSDISLLAYSENGNANDVVVARFQQDYQSSNFSSEMKKRLYLQRQSQQWKIMYEGR